MKSLSYVQLFATPWTVAYQAPPSMGFSRQEYGAGCHFLLQGIFPTQGSNPDLPHNRQRLHRLSHQGSNTRKDGLKMIKCRKYSSFILLPVMAKKKKKKMKSLISLFPFYVRSEPQGEKKHRLQSKPKWPLALVSVHNTHSIKCMVSRQIPSSGARLL